MQRISGLVIVGQKINELVIVGQDEWTGCTVVVERINGWFIVGKGGIN